LRAADKVGEKRKEKGEDHAEMVEQVRWSRSSRALRGEDDIDQKKEGKRRGTGRGRKGSGPGGGEKKRGERARERGSPREGFGFSLFSFYLKHLNSKPVSVLNLKQR
jgi:hypothetical protein